MKIINSSCTLDYPWAVSIDLGKTLIWGNLRFYPAFLAQFRGLTQTLKCESKGLDNIAWDIFWVVGSFMSMKQFSMVWGEKQRKINLEI